MATTIEQLKQLMHTTQEEDEQYFKEVIRDIEVQRNVGRPTELTTEKLLERKLTGDRRRYYY